MKLIWLDCDPGHDDALAILLALHSKDTQLLGISTTHGNAFPEHTYENAVRLLHAFGADKEKTLCYRGARRPLLTTRPLRSDPEIHGDDGLGGVVGLPAFDFEMGHEGEGGAVKGVERAIQFAKESKQKITFINTGPMTNMAIFLTVHPDLVDLIDEIVFMGGGVGIGNRSAVAEYNILCDPEAAQIVLDAPVKTVMVPLNITHQCIFTPALNEHLQSVSGPSRLRTMLSSLVLFFAHTYDSVFGFKEGPPVHDAAAVAYVVAPEIFTTKRYRVDVELNGKFTTGETVVDIWNYLNLPEEDTPHDWSRGKNCVVAEHIQVSKFFELLFSAVQRADNISPLNKTGTV